jgi:hypothetical protein
MKFHIRTHARDVPKHPVAVSFARIAQTYSDVFVSYKLLAFAMNRRDELPPNDRFRFELRSRAIRSFEKTRCARDYTDR